MPSGAHQPEYGFFTTQAPDPRLAGLVNLYMGHDRDTRKPVLRRLAAYGYIVTNIDLDSPTRRGIPGSPTPAAVSPVSGLSDGPTGYETIGRQRCILIELTPPGAWALFNCPLQEIANTSVGLADLLGPEAQRLAERLHDTPDWPTRFAIVDSWLCGRMLNASALPWQVHGVWRELIASAGRTRINLLAETTGWTRQNLNRRFRREIGLSPKTVGRIARLYRAIELMAVPNPPRWSEVAMACGYTDQSHLNLDFRALTDRTPTELVTLDATRGQIYLGSRLTEKLISSNLDKAGTLGPARR